MAADRTDILGALCREISIITHTDVGSIDPAADLGKNGIDSMSFLELLLFIKNEWGVDYIGAGLPPDAQHSIDALAGHIQRDLSGK